MRKIFVIITVFGLMISSVKAQSGLGIVSGKITGSSKPIDAASISILKASDSSVVKRAISNKTGGFQIQNLPEGKYLVNISAVGYSPMYKSITVDRQSTSIDLSSIELQVTSKGLKDVVVTASKALIEQ